MASITLLWKRFFQANKHEAKLEHISPFEVSINTWLAPTYKLDYPPALANEIVDTIKPLLETWTGERDKG